MLTTTTLLTILTILGAVMFIITVHAIILGIIYTKKKEKEKNTHDKILLDLNNLEHDEFYEELKKLKENKKEENKKEKLNQTKVEEVNNQAMMEGLYANTNWKEKEKEKPDLLQNFVDLLQKPKFVDLLKGYATKLKDKFADSVAEYLKDNPNFNPNDLSPSILMQVLKDNPNFFAEVIDLTKNLIKDNPDLFKDFPPDIIKGVSLITITDFFKNFPNPTPPFNPFPNPKFPNNLWDIDVPPINKLTYYKNRECRFCKKKISDQAHALFEFCKPEKWEDGSIKNCKDDYWKAIKKFNPPVAVEIPMAVENLAQGKTYIQNRECVHCKTKIPDQIHSSRRYCSSTCNRMAYKVRRKGKEGKAKVRRGMGLVMEKKMAQENLVKTYTQNRECEYCKTKIPDQVHGSRTYCSTTCSRGAYRGVGKKYNYYVRKYKSPEELKNFRVNNLAKARLLSANYLAQENLVKTYTQNRECEYCKTKIPDQVHGKIKKYCSRTCMTTKGNSMAKARMVLAKNLAQENLGKNYTQNNGILVSNGEIVDKVTILEIKLSKAEGEKKKLIALELQALNEKYTQILKTEGVDEQTKLLYEVNQTLWKVEDKLRILEKKKLFDELFIRKARSVYKLNDSRAEIKLKINQLTGSILSEVKLYK